MRMLIPDLRRQAILARATHLSACALSAPSQGQGYVAALLDQFRAAHPNKRGGVACAWAQLRWIDFVLYIIGIEQRSC